jgi:hypothetical protein
MDAIGVWPAPWADRCMLEANKFWFYSLLFSILSAIADLLFNPSPQPSRERKSSPKKLVKKKSAELRLNSGKKKREKIKRGLIADAFDLLIPGHVTGWIPTGMATVGFASAISTTLSSRDIWDRLR